MTLSMRSKGLPQARRTRQALFATALALGLMGSAMATAQGAPAGAPAAAPPAPAGLTESVAAVVNHDVITTFDLAQRMRQLIATTGMQVTEATFPQLQREALVSLVDERLQIQELRHQEREQKIELIATDEEVNEELDGLAKSNNVTKEQLLGQLASRGVGAGTLREQLRAEVSWQRWIRGRYGSRLRIGEDQIKAMEQRLAASANKQQYQISEVFLDASRVGGMETAVQGASQLVAQLQQGAPFAAVARQFSASPTAATGGDAGWVMAGELTPEVERALEQMRPGQLSAPIPVRDGVYIIHLRDKRSGAGAPLVALKQAAVALAKDAPAAELQAAQAKLEQVRAANPSCASLEAAAGQVQGVVATDLGEANLTDLAGPFRQAAEQLQPGQLSAPIRTDAGLHLVAVCGRRASGADAPNHDQIENRLFAQQLTMISRRYLRDLRNSATIETR
jgi:peptidyl-prolyl cis-trans isomerase SurA